MPTEANLVKSLFLAALEKGTPAERTAFLDQACVDAAVRQRVEELLRAHEQWRTFSTHHFLTGLTRKYFRTFSPSVAVSCFLHTRQWTR